MKPQGIDGLAWMQQLAGRIDRMHDRVENAAALDDVEYLMEALDPELQAPAYQLAEALRHRLAQSDA